jgi:hypothetical protein
MTDDQQLVFFTSSGVLLFIATFLFADDLSEDFATNGSTPIWKRLLTWICLGLSAISFGGAAGILLRDYL